jgi:signal transduction histidine kinase
MKFLLKLVQSSDYIKAPELRRRATAANCLMLTYLIFVAFMFSSSFFLTFKTATEKQNTIATLGICLAIFCCAYLLGKTRYHLAGNLIFIATIYIGCAVTPFQSGDPESVFNILPFLIVPGLLGAFLLPWKLASITLSVGCLLTIWLPYHFQLLQGGSQNVFLVIFNLVVYAIVTVGTLLRVWDEKQMTEDRMQMIKSSKMQALGQMAGNIAHEMNSPIGAIILRSSQLKRLYAKELPSDKEKILSLVSDIEKTAEDISKTVDGLLRMVRNNGKNHSQPILISNVLEHTLRICRQRIENHGIAFSVESYDENLQCVGDETQVSQILLNLLTNAQQAIAKLENKWISIKITSNQSGVSITVTDSGNGISEEIAAKIFEPFFTTKQIGEGTGLGLSLSREMARNMNGNLNLDPTNAHTSFTITLPSVALGDGMRAS